MSLIDQAALNSMLRSDAGGGLTVTYYRGERSVEISGVVTGATMFAVETRGGATVRARSVDFFVSASNLVLPPDTTPTVPARGDRIVCGGYSYLVASPPTDEPDARQALAPFASSEKTWRIHTILRGME